MAKSFANDAVRSVAMQHGRVTRPSLVPSGFDHIAFQREADLRFMLLALRWLREACQRAAAITGDAQVSTALAEFDSSLPAAKDMRDVGEHLMEYVEGRGKLQRDSSRIGQRGAEPSLAVRIWEEGNAGTLSFGWAGMTLDVDDALTAAQKLYGVVLRAELT